MERGNEVERNRIIEERLQVYERAESEECGGQGVVWKGGMG